MTDDGTVQFTIELPGNIDSRAIADGMTADQLTVAVYDAEGNELTQLKVEKEIPHQTTVEFKLVKGQTYSFAFWAQADGAPYTFNTANKTVNVSYENAKSNDEARDAFYAYKTVTVNGPLSETIYLTRPFAQLNYGADDMAAAIAAGVTVTQSAVTVNHAANAFNLATGESTGDVEVTFTKEVLPNDPSFLTVNEIPYNWMAMNYFLVPNNQATIETSLQLFEEGATNPVREITVPNVPVQINHRTNIVGSLFTEDVNFNVIIDERFDQPDYIRDLNRPAVPDGYFLIGNVISDDLAEAIEIANGEPIYMGKGTYNTQITVGDGETVKLIAGQNLNRDEVVINKQIKATEGATLELDGITVNGNASANEAGIYAEGATVKLNAVTSTGNRGMNIFGNCNVTIDNSEFIATGSYCRGLNIGDGHNTVIVKNSKISAPTYYALNFISSANNENVTLNNCEIEGWAIVNMWGKNCVINAENCKCISINVNSGSSNAFSAIMLNESAENNTINFKNNSSFYIEAKGNQPQWLLYLDGSGNTTNFEKVNVKGVNTLWASPIAAGSQEAIDNNTYSFDDNCIIDWSE